jgi:hypothetical protein
MGVGGIDDVWTVTELRARLLDQYRDASRGLRCGRVSSKRPPFGPEAARESLEERA